MYVCVCGGGGGGYIDNGPEEGKETGGFCVSSAKCHGRMHACYAL